MIIEVTQEEKELLYRLFGFIRIDPMESEAERVFGILIGLKKKLEVKEDVN